MPINDSYLYYRYNEGSVKESTRIARSNKGCRVYSLLTTTRLPPQSLLLSESSNKKQLIELITSELMTHGDTVYGTLIITGTHPVPIQIQSGILSQRVDLMITHKEADTMIIRQIIQADMSQVLVVADDTDVFILLCHFVAHGDIKGQVVMISPIKGRLMIDINATVNKSRPIMSNLLSAHGLTGCNTVATYHRSGKGTVIKVLNKKQINLDKIGNVACPFHEVIDQATKFLLCCYGCEEYKTMTEARQKVWSSRLTLSIGGSPKLQTLPPTTEATNKNIARAHFQVATWQHDKNTDPPQLDPTKFGWQKEGSSLRPVTVPNDISLVPHELLKLLKCSCGSVSPCQTKRCGCNNANMACTEFCACSGGDNCFNEKTIEGLQAQNESDSEDTWDSDASDDEQYSNCVHLCWCSFQMNIP